MPRPLSLPFNISFRWLEGHIPPEGRITFAHEAPADALRQAQSSPKPEPLQVPLAKHAGATQAQAPEDQESQPRTY